MTAKLLVAMRDNAENKKSSNETNSRMLNFFARNKDSKNERYHIL